MSGLTPFQELTEGYIRDLHWENPERDEKIITYVNANIRGFAGFLANRGIGAAWEVKNMTEPEVDAYLKNAGINIPKFLARVSGDMAQAKTTYTQRALIESLEDLALNGYEDFGGSYVNLQVQKADVEKARQLLASLRDAADNLAGNNAETLADTTND